jgi:hypothetical protein
MIPAPFDYKRASSAAEAIALVSEYGEDAKFLAGGHSLLPLMKLRLAQPAVLIDIARITDLSYIRCLPMLQAMWAIHKCDTAAPLVALLRTLTPHQIFPPPLWL